MHEIAPCFEGCGRRRIVAERLAALDKGKGYPALDNDTSIPEEEHQ